MKALVTGAAGFIGSHLVRRLLAEGVAVVGLDRAFASKGLTPAELDRIDTIEADACDREIVTAAARGCELVFAFAALVGVEHYAKNPVRTMQVEEHALEAACAAAMTAGCRKLIYPSSSAVYGDTAGELREDQPVSPTSNYAVAKHYGESYLRAQYQECGLHSVALRIFNVYGPGQDERLVIPRFVRCALSGEPITIFGNGMQSRDFPYVDDVVEAIWRCALRLEGCEVVNVSTGRSHSLREVAETVIRAADSISAVRLEPLPPDRQSFEVASSRGSTARLRALTGFVPATSLEDGIAGILEQQRHG